MRNADVVIIGAGIAGVSTAYHLAVEQDVSNVVIVDPLPPLTLTSDKSTECFRNWWPNASMVGLMNRSIDILESVADATNNSINLTRAGYLYATADPETLDEMTADALRARSFGGGEVRRHPGPVPYGDAPDGVDILGPDELKRHHSYITDRAVGALQVRRAGYFSAQQLGSWMLEEARGSGATLIQSRVTSIKQDGTAVSGVALENGSEISAANVVMAAGPMSKDVAALAGVDLPLSSELHIKVAFRDHLGVIPRDAGMFIWADEQDLEWTDDERHGLRGIGRAELTERMPIFCHGRPEGGEESAWFVALWEYHRDNREPEWPLPEDELYPEVVMKGLTTMIPGLSPYLEGLPEHVVDGGYYIKTRENRPLIGPCGPDGFHVITGFSGFGVMVASGAGDLAARHIAQSTLPPHAGDFLLSRYERPEYLEMIEGLGSGQL